MTTIDVEPELSPSGMGKLHEYWGLIVRGKWGIIGSIVLSLTAAVIFCMVSPKLYRSETLILVEDQKIADQYVQGVVEGNLEQRIFVIQKQIMSSTLLRKIVKDLGLYPDEVQKSGPDAAVARVRSGIKVELMAKMPGATVVSGRSSIDALTISFHHEDPATAMQVTSAIASAFIEENLKTREHLAEATTEFLDTEVTRAKRALEEKEDEISQFKSKHMGQLPQQVEANLRALDRLQTDLKAVNENMQRASDRLAMVGKGIQEYERFGKMIPTLSNSPATPDPLFRRLKELREKLTRLKSEFWDGYPDVPLTKEEIRQVEAELVEAYGPDAIKVGEKPLDPYLQDLKKQQSEATSELTVLKQRQHLLLTERNEYLNRVEQAPAVEQKLLTLMRDYDNMKSNYLALGDKRLNARVAENLEKRQKGAQFRILDPANFPRAPYKPNQPLIIFFGLIFGCTIGIGVAVVREQLNPQFRHPEDVEYVLGPQLLAVIPHFMAEFGRLTMRAHLAISHAPGRANGSGSGTPARAGGWKRLVRNGEAKGWRQEMGFVAKWWPNSVTSEQYRVAATRLALLEQNGHSTVAAVTSAVKGEGKTTTVVNLGYTLARDLGKRTLLLECDFGRPTLHRYLETPPQWGLADALQSGVPFEDCISRFGDVPCWIMPIGTCQTSVSELLKTAGFRQILTRCRAEFDYILINTPPILPQATMNMLEQHVDLILLVVRASSTSHNVVKRARNSLRAKKPVHVILNAVESQSLPNYMYDSYAEQVARLEQPSSSG